MQPPKRLDTIAQAACYEHFRPSSRWMLVLQGTDEFIGVDTKRRLDGERVSDLGGFIAVAERGHTQLAALEFARHEYISCPVSRVMGRRRDEP